MVKNLPSNAGDAGSTPGQGTKIPRAVGQLSPCATTTELVRLKERACAPQTTEPTSPGAHVPQPTEPTRSGACTSQLERENRHATTREKPAHHNEEPACLNKDPATKTKCSQKIIIIIK